MFVFLTLTRSRDSLANMKNASDAPERDPAMLAQFEFERRPLDFYPTPARATEALLKVIGDDLMAYQGWECAAGTGAITHVVKDFFRDFVSTDIVPYEGFAPDGIVDFLHCNLEQIEALVGFRPDAILTNPPYGKLAEQFARKALELMEPQQGLVIMICRHEWDAAKSRSDLFDHPAFAIKLTLRFRPRWIEGTDGAPRFPYSWYIWNWAKPAAAKPELLYID